MADTHTYEFNISMSCGGCSGAIDRVLKKLEGVESYDVSLENQTAKVVTALPYDTVLQKIAKTGKKVNSGKADGVEQSVEVVA
ncbi:Ff.00g052460.m01.CDS01 [Fusarium sp. VM40]|nr:Ff.00g052460.m01.CDS01 [Fusarium sp. VM40]